MNANYKDEPKLAAALHSYLKRELLARGIREAAIPILPEVGEILSWTADYFAEWIEEEDTKEIARARSQTVKRLLRSAAGAPPDGLIEVIRELILNGPQDRISSAAQQLVDRLGSPADE